MADREKLFAALRRALPDSARLSFEWSLRIDPDGVRERDKLICWVHHDRGRADREIAACRTLLGDFPFLATLPSAHIVNLGVGIGAAGWHLYVHFVAEDGRTRYLAFDGAREIEYRFHYFPCTPELAPPEAFVRAADRPLFLELAADARLQALSGFWLRHQGQVVDQVCLSYVHRPPLRELFPVLRRYTRADLASYADVCLKHLAFGADGALTVYVSGRSAAFPADIADMRRQAATGARRSHEHMAAFLHGLSIPPRPRNQALDAFYSPADGAAWRKLLGPEMFYHFGLFDAADDPRDTWNDRPFLRATEDLCRHAGRGEHVYDLGCGYGGIARHLRDAHDCTVLGATISRAQFRHCHAIGIPCRYTDMEMSLPPGRFDTVLMCESLEHVHDKFALLKKLRRFAGKLVIRTNTQETPAQNVVFGGSMRTVPAASLVAMLEECGWRIVHLEDQRARSMPTIDVWKARLDAVRIDGDPHYDAWKTFTDRVARAPEAWARQHKLLDVVAV